MTPEERAEKVYGELEGWTHQNKIRLIADAIRTAVAEERAACAKVAEELAKRADEACDPQGNLCGISYVDKIAPTIRARSQETMPDGPSS